MYSVNLICIYIHNPFVFSTMKVTQLVSIISLVSGSVLPTGKYMRQLANTQLECGPGTRYSTVFRRRSGRNRCIGCTSGRYNDIVSTQKDECYKCPSGKYVFGERQAQCKGGPVCAAGKWGTVGSTEPTTACYDCEVGRFQSIPGQGSCISCPSGKYTDQKAQTTCLGNVCPMGKFGTMYSTQQGDCTECPSGQYVEYDGSFQCKVCGKDTYQNQAGQSACKPIQGCSRYYDFNTHNEQCEITHKYIQELSYFAWGAFGLNLMATFSECYYLFFWFASMVIAAHTMVSKNVSDGSFYTMSVVIGGCYVLPIMSLTKEYCRKPTCILPGSNDKDSPKTTVSMVVPRDKNSCV